MAQGEKEFGLASKGQRQHLHQVSLLHDLPGDLEPKNQSPPLVVWVGPLRKGGLGSQAHGKKKCFKTCIELAAFPEGSGFHPLTLHTGTGADARALVGAGARACAGAGARAWAR